jgi:hypothetical protein
MPREAKPYEERGWVVNLIERLLRAGEKKAK